MKIGLKLKSSFFLALLLLLTVGTLSFFVLRGIHNNQKRQYEDYLIQQGNVASNYIKQIYLMESIKDPEVFIKDRAQELVKRFEMITGMQVVLYNMQGEEVADSTPLAGKSDVNGLLKYALKDIHTYIEEGDTIIFLAPLHNLSGQIGILQMNYPVTREKLFYNDMKHLFLFAGIIIFIICFLCGNLFFRPLTKGILRLKYIAQRIEEGIYSDMEPLKRKDELGDLSRSIYFMGSKIDNQWKEMTEKQNKLKEAVEKLEILGLQQKQFIGNVTHEFKTPLTVIKAYADLMYLYNDDPNLLKDAKSNIDKESQRLIDMLDKVLSLSALENYNFEFKKESVNLQEILWDICERLQGKIIQNDLQLHTSLDNLIITADKERVVQIFINLIDNAIKYNRTGGHIWVSCKKDNSDVSIRIRDTGIGIPKEARSKIFTPFYTINKVKTESTGLGLALVKELTQKQGGSVQLLDTNEEETIFEVRFPIR